MTADGQLRTCLFSLRETDLRGLLRDGADDDELETALRDAVWRKELKHHVNDAGFVQPTGRCRRSAAEAASPRRWLTGALRLGR